MSKNAKRKPITTPLNSLQDLFDQIEKTKKEMGFKPGEECFYRGESRSYYDLMPSLLRKKYKTMEDLRWTESSLYYEFSARARIAQSSNLSDWDVLFYMRHHGVPTRLIDWTETLGVALYFATLSEAEDSTPCLWLLNPYLLNKITWEVRDLISPDYLLNPYDNAKRDYSYVDFLEDPNGFEVTYPVAIYPPQKSDRMLAQRGWFTFHGTKTVPLNKMAKVKNCYRKIIMPKTLIESIHDFLTKAGINDYTMFPDLDGLSKYLNLKYDFIKR